MPEEFFDCLLNGRDSQLRAASANGAHFSTVQGLSLALHFLLLTLLLHVSLSRIEDTSRVPSEEVVKRLIFPRGGGGGNGGNRSLTPPTRGTPPEFTRIQVAPPTPRPIQDAKLTMKTTLVGPPELRPPQFDAQNWGSPFLSQFTNSAGPGEKGGVGDGCCGGIGPDGNGRGLGPGEESGMGGSFPFAGTAGTTMPICEYCPNPGFTEEARKAKFFGSVLLRVAVTADGRATNIRVVKGAGFGLDEQAIQAVSGWKFKAAKSRDGRPVATWTDIEISFRIY